MAFETYDNRGTIPANQYAYLCKEKGTSDYGKYISCADYDLLETYAIFECERTHKAIGIFECHADTIEYVSKLYEVDDCIAIAPIKTSFGFRKDV